MASFLARKKDACHLARVFFSVQESLPNKNFLPQDDEKTQHQHKGKPHIQEKSQDAATSMKDAITNSYTAVKLRLHVYVSEESA